ncbi:unnamed protein product [Gulo gulo]|uniref:Uncharacterized protein n=1 Tax=Gulo gulo TaxID=48420 RepID=A0A9X9Q8F0_GULGU|nr:unnamed protein product [Gulo gulo]
MSPRPACPYQPASESPLGDRVGPRERHLWPGDLHHTTCPAPSRGHVCSSVFPSVPWVGRAGRCWKGRGHKPQGHRCRSNIFLSIDRLIINIH